MARHADRYPPNYAQDELRYRIRHELFLRPDQNTFTFRNKMNQTALPIRVMGRVHAAQRRRRRRRALERRNLALPAERLHAQDAPDQRYGANFLPEDMTIQDWGVTYDDLEPHYDAFEYLCGTSGTAGNMQGQNSGRWQSVRRAALAALSQSGAEAGLRPHAVRQGGARARLQAVSATVRQHVAGLRQPARRAAGAMHLLRLLRMVRVRQLFKGAPQTTILPVLIRKSNFTARDNSRSDADQSRRVRQTRNGSDVRRHQRRGMGAARRPRDPCGLHDFQRAAPAAFKDRQALRSGCQHRRIGRNFTHQAMSSVDGFFDNKKFNFNPFIASGAIGMCIDEFNGDNFDHGPHGFVGGGYLGQVQTNGRPIETTPVPKGTPKWGAKWKDAVRDNYLSNLKGGSIHGSFYSYRDVYLDLDPTYHDRFGRPLIRMTIDFHENELKAARS